MVDGNSIGDSAGVGGIDRVPGGQPLLQALATARGNERRVIFRDEADHQRFLRVLCERVELKGHRNQR